MTDYYELELDDMVIALNNKDIDIELLQKKLDIAVKALKHMAKFPAYYHDYTGPAAQKALKEIEEVK